MKKKIVFIIESLSGGGAEKVLTVLLKYINKEKFDITVCSVVDTGVYVNEIKKIVNYKSIISGNQNTLWYKLKYKLVYSWLPLSLVYKLFVPKNNDIEIAYVEGFATKLLSFSSNNSTKKIAWVHTDLINNHWIELLYKNKKEEKECYDRIDYVVGVSNVVSRSVITLYEHKNVSTLYNVVDSDNIVEQAFEKINMPLSSSKVRLISVGRFVPQKGFERLIRIIKSLKDKGYLVELFLLGDGPLRNKYETLISEFSLKNEIFLIGFQKNPYPYFKSSDIFVCSSIVEGLSTVVSEAIILGLPIVTTNCSGMEELLKERTCGIITENSEVDLLNGIESLLKDTELLKKYKDAVLERRGDFSICNSVTKIEEYLLGL